MKKLFYIAALTLLYACQIEDDNAPTPDDSFIKYLGVIADQQAKDIEPVFADDGITMEGFVIFGTQQFEDSTDSDYYVIRTDLEGTILATAAIDPRRNAPDLNGNGLDDDILEGDEIAGQIEVLRSGGFILMGTTSVTDQTQDLTDFRFITGAILDADLNVISDSLTIFNRNVSGTSPLSLIANDVLQLEDGSLLVVGSQETTAGDFDYYYAKLGNGGFEETAGLTGTENDDVLVRAFETDNQTIALFGYSERQGNDGEEGTNVGYFEINQNGNPAGGSGNFGIPDSVDASNVTREYDDILHDVIEKPGGYLAVGTATIDENDFAFFMDIDFNGISTRKGRILSEIDSDFNTQAFGVTASSTNDFIVVGRYNNYRVDALNEQRGEEAMFVRIDQTGNKVAGFESNYGVGDGNDTAADAITLPDGKIMVATTIDFGGGIRMIGLIKLNDTGLLDN